MTKHPVEFYVDDRNWPQDLDEAKEFAAEAIEAWAFKDKQEKFLMEINACSTLKRVQELVIYPLLSGEGIGVIK